MPALTSVELALLEKVLNDAKTEAAAEKIPVWQLGANVLKAYTESGILKWIWTAAIFYIVWLKWIH